MVFVNENNENLPGSDWKKGKDRKATKHTIASLASFLKTKDSGLQPTETDLTKSIGGDTEVELICFCNQKIVRKTANIFRSPPKNCGNHRKYRGGKQIDPEIVAKD